MDLQVKKHNIQSGWNYKMMPKLKHTKWTRDQDIHILAKAHTWHDEKNEMTFKWTINYRFIKRSMYVLWRQKKYEQVK